MTRELEWRNKQGIWVLCLSDGEVVASVRQTPEHLWVAKYGGEIVRSYGECDEARRAMVRRDEEIQRELLEGAKKQADSKKEKKEKKDAGKDS